MTHTQLAYFHLATVVPSFVLGGYLLLSRKGSQSHRQTGKLYLLLMATTGVVTLLMPAEVGPQFFGHFGYIHIFSLLTLYLVPSAYIAARKGNIKRHRGNMFGLYIGGILIAGSFAFAPGRLLHTWLFG